MPTDGQWLEVYQYMLRHQELIGEPPSMRQIQDNVEGLNYRSSVLHNLLVLEDKGYVEQVKPPGMTRRWKAVR